MATSSIQHLPTARYRPSRDERTDAVVLQAAVDELNERGYAAASLRTIAARADVELETVFERWRSKQHLMLEAIAHLAGAQPAPETGDVRTDLVQVAEAFADLLVHPGVEEVVRSLLASADASTAAAVALKVGVLGERRAAIRRIVERGQRRQQCSSTVHPGVAADAIVGALLFRLLVSGEPVTRQVAVRTVALALATPTT